MKLFEVWMKVSNLYHQQNTTRYYDGSHIISKFNADILRSLLPTQIPLH